MIQRDHSETDFIYTRMIKFVNRRYCSRGFAMTKIPIIFPCKIDLRWLEAIFKWIVRAHFKPEVGTVLATIGFANDHSIAIRIYAPTQALHFQADNIFTCLFINMEAVEILR